MPRSDRLYLTDMVEAIDAVERYIRGRSRDDFLGDEILRDAVLRRLTIIGEAAARLTPQFRQRHSEIAWGDVVAFRNFAVHAYFAVDWRVVWTTAHQNVPELRFQIADILAADNPTPEESDSETP
jgi:uncharacterized protein with HEPN domain